MENSLKKKRIRNIAIVVILAVMGVLVFARTEFAFADYSKELNAQILNSERVLKDAEVGNENGQYSEYDTEAFEKSIGKAKEVLKDEEAKNKEFKAARKELKNEQNSFQQSANTEAISAEELDKIKNGKEVFAKTVKYGDEEATWHIDPASVKKSETFNPGVKIARAYEEEITKETEKLEKEVTSVAVLHNGDLPCVANLSIGFESDIKNIQVYHYDTDDKNYGNLIKGEVSDGELTFPVEKGGVYVIINVDVKDVKKVGQVLKSETAKVKKDVAEKSDNKKEDQTAETEKTGDESNKTEDKKPGKNESNSNSTDKPATKPEAKPADRYCTVTIRCDTIADHSKITNESIIPYVPSDGVILGVTEVKLEDGDSAFDVIQRVTSMYGIPMASSYSAVYDSAYIEGINHIYEFDGGSGSGWMYKVNGWFPNYGVTNYVMEDGDVMEFHYTCNIGKDLGAPMN